MYDDSKQTINKSGFFGAITACLMWGILPIYWKMMQDVSSTEIIAHRILWSFVFMAGLCFALRKKSNIINELKIVLKDRYKLFLIALGGFLISINWLVYIWAVNHNKVLETSLGYYIYPLCNVVIAMVFLEEKLYFGQKIAICLAFLGVANLVVTFGSLPWVALLLALSMSFYALIKKKVALGGIAGMLAETMFIAPLALLYLLGSYSQVSYAFPILSKTTFLLIGTGIITAIPLILFANSINKLSLSLIGFIQYSTPTITFLMGVFLFNEHFTRMHLITFVMIWVSLIVFTISAKKHSKSM